MTQHTCTQEKSAKVRTEGMSASHRGSGDDGLGLENIRTKLLFPVVLWEREAGL